MKAKIAFLYGPTDLRLQEVELPPLKANQVLVKLGACGICGSDIECFEGKSKEGRYDIAPYTPGHEWAGTVVETGAEVKTFKAGDKITSECVMNCGVCSNCKDGLMPSACLNMREIGFRPDSPGGMGEYLIVEENYIHKLPADWSFPMGAWVETFSIGYFGLWGNGGYIDASDSAVIYGCGPVGISALMVAKTAGAQAIIVDPIKGRRDLAKTYRADFALDPTTAGFRDEILRITGGRGPSVIVEASGNDAAITSMFEIAGHSCRINIIGHSIGHRVPVEIGNSNWRTLKIKGAAGTRSFTPRTIRFMSAIKDAFDFKALNTHYIKFEKIHEAFEIAAHHKEAAFKVMLTFDK